MTLQHHLITEVSIIQQNCCKPPGMYVTSVETKDEGYTIANHGVPLWLVVKGLGAAYQPQNTAKHHCG